jgi:hypothetical protein
MGPLSTSEDLSIPENRVAAERSGSAYGPAAASNGRRGDAGCRQYGHGDTSHQRFTAQDHRPLLFLARHFSPQRLDDRNGAHRRK